MFGLCVVMPQRAAAQGTSTPEERARWDKITRKLESNPLDESVNKDGEAALNRLSNARDIHVPLCPALLSEFNDPKYKYRHEITRQYLLASGAFIIENPAKAGDTNGYRVLFEVGDGNVGLSVAIKIGYHDPSGVCTSQLESTADTSPRNPVTRFIITGISMGYARFVQKIPCGNRGWIYEASALAC